MHECVNDVRLARLSESAPGRSTNCRLRINETRLCQLRRISPGASTEGDGPTSGVAAIIWRLSCKYGTLSLASPSH